MVVVGKYGIHSYKELMYAKKIMSKMKPKVALKLTHVHWFVHMHVMANLFNIGTIHQMPTIGKLMFQH